MKEQAADFWPQKSMPGVRSNMYWTYCAVMAGGYDAHKPNKSTNMRRIGLRIAVQGLQSYRRSPSATSSERNMVLDVHSSPHITISKLRAIPDKLPRDQSAETDTTHIRPLIRSGHTMADMDTKSTEIVNCFPSLQCISGNIPDECKTGNIVCPTLPRSTSDSNITFPKPPAGIASTAVSSDSESGSEATKQRFQTQSQHSHLTSDQQQSQPQPTRPIRPHRRIPHTIIERRYRDNLNTQIETLRLSLPSLKNAYVCSPDVEDSALPPRLPSKAMIIATAATYIKELEQERQAAMEAVQNLQQQVVDLQKLIQCNDCSILQYLQAVGGGQQQGQQGGGQGGVVAV